MDKLKSAALKEITSNVVSEEHTLLDERHARDSLNQHKKYRPLTGKEVERLVLNNNRAESWQDVLIADDCNIDLIHNCEFMGLVRIAGQTKQYLEYHKMRLPVGLYNSLIISCDIGENVSIRNVHYLSRYVLADNVILLNIDEMYTVDNAKFGIGTVKKGETEDVRVRLEICNENGGRSVSAFPGMLSADAYLWSRYRENKALMERFAAFTDDLSDGNRGHFGFVGYQSVIKDSRIIKDVRVGEHCYIKGANKLKNLTIMSAEDEPTQIGEGVELVNGIISPANKIFYGSKCVRFVTGRNVQVKYGARVLNSYLGCNSTVSCCEILNNLVFPFHEQHHNNSFLIASTVMGQSNIAAGATIGSNHNSRAADGEIIAGRGFWPGLQSSFKHNCLFSCFTLVAKGSYEAEMNINLPFSLVSKNEANGMLQVFPGFWFRYNMYALARNAWKFKNRDKRRHIDQHIEMDYLAPDTVLEMLNGIEFLKRALQEYGHTDSVEEDLNFSFKDIRDLQVAGITNKAPAHILKPLQGLKLYSMMVDYFCARELLGLLAENDGNVEALKKAKIKAGQTWHNVGGQLVEENDLKTVLNDLTTGKITSWQKLHERYNRLWRSYPQDRRFFALAIWLEKWAIKQNAISGQHLVQLLEKALKTDKLLLEWTIESRRKDYESPFRKATYRNDAEMDAVLGELKNNPFIKIMQNQHKEFTKQVKEATHKLLQ